MHVFHWIIGSRKYLIIIIRIIDHAYKYRKKKLYKNYEKKIIKMQNSQLDLVQKF